MGDFEDAFGTGADAVNIIDRFDRQESFGKARSSDDWEDPRNDIELREMLSRNSPFEDLPKFYSSSLVLSGQHNTFSEFIDSFSEEYNNGCVGEHIAILLEYAAFRSPESIRALRQQWYRLYSANKFDLGGLTIESRENLIAPIARVGIGALMVAGISGDEIKAIYAALRHGRYT